MYRICVIVFSWVPFCLVPFQAVPNNRTAILVCPFWKAVDIMVVSKPLSNFWINYNSKMAFVLNFHFDWCLFWCYAILVCPALKAVDVIVEFTGFRSEWFQMKGCFFEMQWHFSMLFFEICWCFWRPTLTTTVQLYPLHWW